MQNPDILINNFEVADLYSLAKLSESTYPGGEISDVTYLKWEYEDNPDGSAIYSVAQNQSESISQYVVIPRKYSIDNAIYNGSLSVNTLTHSEFRGKNIFPELAARTFDICTEQKINFTIGFPNSNSLPVIRKKKLFEIKGNLSLLVYSITPFRSFIKYIFNRERKYGKEIDLILPNFVNEHDGISELNIQADKNLYNEFLLKLNREKQNLTLRSPEFLEWRYIKIPRRKYCIFKILEEGTMSAIAILRAKYIYGLKCGILVDFCALKNFKKINVLFDSLRAIAKLNNLDLLIAAVSPQSDEYLWIRKYGYINVPSKLQPQKLTFVIKRHLLECPLQVENFDKWFLTFGDYDIF